MDNTLNRLWQTTSVALIISVINETLNVVHHSIIICGQLLEHFCSKGFPNKPFADVVSDGNSVKSYVC